MARHDKYFILCSFDIDDLTMNNDEVRRRLDSYPKVRYHFGASKNKIEAINRDMELAPHWDVLINMSDDMRFLYEGFDLTILDDMYRHFPGGGGALAYWDQGRDTKGTGLITLAVIDRKFYKKTGFIYSYDYDSVWCDNEMTHVAKILGWYAFCEAQIVSHDHPANGIGVMDAQYKKTEAPAVHNKDQATFLRRLESNFFLSDEMLSILICTMPERQEMFDGLMWHLEQQIKMLPSWYRNKVSVHYNEKDHIVGRKRNMLLKEAKGDFVVFIDDDDIVADDYIQSILEAISLDPTVDCIGIDGIITTNGADKKNWSISKDYMSWFEKDGVYYRTPNHISPVKREIALKAMFPEIAFGEDYQYSMGILPYLRKETKIKKQIYHYDYRSK